MKYLSRQNENGRQQDNEAKRPLGRQRNIFGTIIKISWKEQHGDPSIKYKTYVYAL